MDTSAPIRRDRSLYQRLLDEPGRMRFPGAVERAFRLHFLREGRGRLRVGFGTGLVLFAAYGIWDCFTFPPELLRWSLPLRFLLVCPLFVVVLLASRYRERVVLMDGLRLAAVVGTGLATALIVALGRHHGRMTGLEGLFLVTIASYTLTGLRTPLALVGGLSILPLEFAAGWTVLGSGKALTDALVFSLTANLVGFIGVATHERASRQNFLRTQILNQTAEEDPLTALPNRRRFEDHLEHVYRTAARSKLALAVAMIDVDHFKAFNDRFGHVAGDDCLRRVGEALRTLGRRPLDLAARIGGEEFAVVWFDASPEAARVLADRLKATLQALAIEHAAGAGDHLTVSSGVVCVAPEVGDEPTDALVAADEALYQAKAAGRDRGVVRVL